MVFTCQRGKEQRGNIQDLLVERACQFAETMMDATVSASREGWA
jgi:hypothetical protein